MADWETELKDFYILAKKMRGAAPCPRMENGDTALKQLAVQMGKEDQFQQTTVGVYSFYNLGIKNKSNNYLK